MIFISRLEALADGIIEYSGYRNPESALYQARNPGALRAHSSTVLRDLEGYRVFKSFRAGFDALLFDLKAKCAGESHTGLTQQSSLNDLMLANGFPRTVTSYVVKFIRRALSDPSISEATAIGYFAE